MNETFETLVGKRLDPDLAEFPSGGIDEPWYTYDAVLFLNKMLRPEYVCFEWGAGASTFWFAERVKHITSIEHDKNWAKKIREIIAAKGITNITLHHKVLRDGNYSTCIRTFPNEHFDVIIVDGAGGKYRREGVIEAVPKLKTHGILVVDDSHYVKCSDCVDFLRYWPSVDTFNNRRSTTFFFKLKGAPNAGFRRYIQPE